MLNVAAGYPPRLHQPEGRAWVLEISSTHLELLFEQYLQINNHQNNITCDTVQQYY